MQQEVQLPTVLKCSTAELAFCDLNVFRDEATGHCQCCYFEVSSVADLLREETKGWRDVSTARSHGTTDTHLLSERGEAWSPLFHLDSLLRNKKVDVLRLSDPPSPMNLSSSCVSPACSSTPPPLLCTRSDHLRLWRTRAAHAGVEVVTVSA